jgi:hypothetical protein
MIDDILQLVTEILVIIDGETSVAPHTDWSSLAPNQKEKLVQSVLNQAFKNAIAGESAGKYAPKDIFWEIMSNYELDDDFDTFMNANEWIKGRIKGFETQYKLGWDEKYEATDPFKGGLIHLKGWFKANWKWFAAIIIIAILAFIFIPKIIKKK